MLIETLGVALLLIFFGIAYVAAKFFRARWHDRQRARAEKEARKGESRQVRRARERQERR